MARIQREFGGRPLSEGAVGSTEAVDALLAGTDALRSQANDERQAAARADALRAKEPAILNTPACLAEKNNS